MKTKLTYQKVNNRFQAELLVLIAGSRLRFNSTAPAVCEAQRELLNSPFAPSEEVLLDEATRPEGGRWEVC